ncbi:hypothetical protein ScPMuIL_011650 [Solemya velum]
MITISVVAYARGNPEKLLYPTDDGGHICGFDAGYTEKPNVVYFDILACAAMGASVITMGCPTPQVCVKECPTYYYSYLYTKALETANSNNPLSSERNKMVCKDGIDPSSGDIDVLVDNEDCAAYLVESTSVLGRCVPSIFEDIGSMGANLLVNATDPNSVLATAGNKTTLTGTLLEEGTKYLALFFEVKEYGEKVFKDVLASWWLILTCLAIGMVVCFIWIIIMRWIAGIMVWLSIIAFLGLWSFACYYSYTKYYELKNTPDTVIGLSQAFTLNFSYYLDLKETWLAFGCTSATLLLLFTLILLFLIPRIRIAIELIKAGSKAIGNMMFTLIWPIFPFILQIVVVGYWAASAIYIASMGSAEFYSNSTTNKTTDGVTYYLERAPCDSADTSALGQACQFVKYGGDEYTIPLEIFMLFMFLWLMNFVIALGQMTLAGAFASYYWAFEKPKDVPAFPLLSALYRSLRYHLGSLAFGSFIIAVVQLIRIFLEYLDQKLNGSENPVAKILLKCLKCCFWCLEKFLKFLNKNAYIMIAVYGRCFCFAAKDAFFLIMRNVVRTVVLDQVTDYLLFIGKLVVTGAVGTGAFFWFQGKVDFFKDYVPTLNYYLTPVIIVILGTYLISCCFFSVYSMAVDTLFLCFLEDLEMNDGSPEKPYYMSKGLKKILGKSNKKLKEVDETEGAPKGGKGKK